MCTWIKDTETVTQFFIHSSNNHFARRTIFQKIHQVCRKVSEKRDSTILLISTNEFILHVKRFICSLIEQALIVR